MGNCSFCAEQREKTEASIDKQMSEKSVTLIKCDDVKETVETEINNEETEPDQPSEQAQSPTIKDGKAGQDQNVLSLACQEVK